MAKIRFAEGLQVVPLKVPGETTADVESAHVKLENMQWLTFIIEHGPGGGSSTALYNFAIKSTTDAAGSTATNDYALPFSYRTATVGTDNWGDITSVTTATGYVQITGAGTGNAIIIDVDPSDIAKHDPDAVSCYVDIDVTADGATDSLICSIVGVFEQRYPQNENLTSS